MGMYLIKNLNGDIISQSWISSFAFEQCFPQIELIQTKPVKGQSMCLIVCTMMDCFPILYGNTRVMNNHSVEEVRGLALLETRLL